MDVSIKDFGDVVIYVGAVAAALGAIAVVMRYVVLRPAQRYIKEQITSRVVAPLDKVKTQMEPNGGSSLKDQMNRVELKVNLISERLDRHLETHTWKESGT